MRKIILGILITISFSAYSQVSMSAEYGSKNKDLNKILYFENIELEKLKFYSNEINGKNYEVNIKEFHKGELIKKTNIFDSSEADFFKIKKDTLNLDFIIKLTDSNLLIQLQGNGFSTPKKKFILLEKDLEYHLKDFLGEKKAINLSLNKENYILSVITPTVHKNGFQSYCEVAQSGGNPEKFGIKFKIPHYFLIEIVFKE